MTVVNEATGEIVETIAADEARRITTEAQNELRSSREHFDRAWSLIEQAVEGGGHVALGYRSPGDYLHQEFDGVLSGLDVSARRIAVRTMTEWGLSTRAIAPVVGTDFTTVSRDIKAGVADATPEPAFVSATDALAELDDTDMESEADIVASAELMEDATLLADDETVDTTTGEIIPIRPTPSNVIGIDGKTYKRPTPAPKPDLTTAEAADYDNATKSSQALARAISKLLQLQHPNMRAGMRDYWNKASIEVPPAQRADVTPEQMRAAAHGLLALADEWTQP